MKMSVIYFIVRRTFRLREFRINGFGHKSDVMRLEVCVRVYIVPILYHSVPFHSIFI